MLRRVIARGGVVVIPAFAVGRAQLLLHLIAQLQASGQVPTVPVFLNSPMATDVTALYRRYHDQHRLDAAALDTLHRTTQIINSVEQSKALNRRKGPMIIVSASGMATDALRVRIQRELGWDAHVPEYLEVADLMP